MRGRKSEPRGIGTLDLLLAKQMPYHVVFKQQLSNNDISLEM